MADIQVDTQAAPSTPGSGSAIIYVDSTTKLISAKNDAGAVQTVPLSVTNRSVAAQSGFAADTYLVGSAIALPAGYPRVGALYRCIFDVTKTGAGVATPIIIVRFGTLGTTGDAARLTFTWAAQTAVIDAGIFEIWALFRTVGAAGVAQGRTLLEHNLAVTGLTSVNPAGYAMLLVTSAGFDTTVANSIIGVSVNGGTSAAWTVQMVISEFTSI